MYRYLLIFALVIPFLTARSQDDPGSFWLKHHGLDFYQWEFDLDGDGFSTRGEYFAGTDPLDPQSFRSVDLLEIPNGIDLSWFSFSGANHQWYETQLLEGVWEPLSDPVPGDGDLLALRHSPLEGNRYFRLEPLSPIDADGDGLSSIEEAMLGTDPHNPDTDGDGLPTAKKSFVSSPIRSFLTTTEAPFAGPCLESRIRVANYPKG